MIEIRLLGAFEVRHKKKPISIQSRPAQSLFAYLVLNRAGTHRREKLAGMLWPDSLEETARDNLRHALWRIRKALPETETIEYILADDLSIGFNPSSAYWLDVAELEGLSEENSIEAMKKTLDAYQGELLPGFCEDWVISEREHCVAIFEQKMTVFMDKLRELREWGDVLEWAGRWISFGQKPESAYRALMSAHAARGDMSKVASTYDRCIKSLKEYGVEPSEQTRNLYEMLKTGKEISSAASAPLQKSERSETPKSNLPVPLTSFIGREKELKEISRLLSASRLLTLTGPGGVGKTRLAIRTAHDSIRKFKDGVFWVDLVGLADENLIPQEIAQSLNVGEVTQEAVIETLKTYLKQRDVLIILDNCEHLIRGCALYAEQLLAECEKLRILATSIEALGLFNETTWQVPSLALPESIMTASLQELQGFASIGLFVERARAANISFALTGENSGAIAQICRRLDGIPLAIELAAARTKLLSVDEIASRLGDRFSLLTSGSRTAIPRHQTLRATIDWSHELLSVSERILLRRLSVFAGGFTLPAAEDVCAEGELKRSEVLDVLARLVDKSLVVVGQASSAMETRYRLLETIRQYALEKLIDAGETAELRDKHLEYVVRLAELAEPHLPSRDHSLWAGRLDNEMDNIRVAIEWSMNTAKIDHVLRLTSSLDYYWFSHRLASSEWHDWIQKALARPESKRRTLLRAKALNATAFLYFGDVVQGDRKQELDEALSIAKEFDDPVSIADTYRNLGLRENVRGNYVEAQKYLEECLAICRNMGAAGRFKYAWGLIFLGDVALNREEVDIARLHYEEVVEILRDVGDANFLAYAVRRLAQILRRKGEYERALILSKESLDLNIQVSSPRGLVGCIVAFAVIALAQGKIQIAAQLMAAVETQMDSMSIAPMYMDQNEYARALELVREKMDEKTLSVFWEKGRRMSFEKAMTFAVSSL